MGYYIQAPTNTGKASYLCHEHGGKLAGKPEKFEDIPEDKALIVVVSNSQFEACGLAFDAQEFAAFTAPQDRRPKKYVLLDKQLAYRLSGFRP